MGIRGIEMQIRVANQSDVQQLFDLYQSENWKTFSKIRIGKLLETSTYLVAEDNGQIIAFARYLTDGVLTTFLAELLVVPHFRRQGIGKLLIDTVKKQLPENRLELISEADDFYERVGFRKVGQGYRLT